MWHVGVVCKTLIFKYGVKHNTSMLAQYVSHKDPFKLVNTTYIVSAYAVQCIDYSRCMIEISY